MTIERPERVTADWEATTGMLICEIPGCWLTRWCQQRSTPSRLGESRILSSFSEGIVASRICPEMSNDEYEGKVNLSNEVGAVEIETIPVPKAPSR